MLYCDDCGAELQRESCNHVRACVACNETMIIKLKELLEAIDNLVTPLDLSERTGIKEVRVAAKKMRECLE